MQPCLTPEQIETIVTRLAGDIAQGNPEIDVCVVLMDGAMMFAADLLRALYNEGIDPKMASLRLSSYGDDKRSRGHITVTADINTDIAGATVLIVDDVLDSGTTLDFARAHILDLGAAEIATCVFARKPYPGRKTKADYAGSDAPNAFLVGYGLDDAGRKRGLPGIWAAD